MEEITDSDLHLVMPKVPPSAASSRNAVESPLKNESGGTGAANAPHGSCFRLRLFIFYAVLPLIIPLVLLICCLYWLLSKLMFIKDVSSPVQVAANLMAKEGNSNFDFELLRKRVADLVREGVAAAKWRLCILLLLLLFVVIVVSVPGLKRIKVLGLPLWIWMVVPSLYVVSNRYISLLGECIVKKLSLKMIKDKYDVVYYLDGLGRSGYNLIVCVVILLAWEFYFRSPRHGLRRYRISEKAHDIGTWTAVSLLIGAFLVLVKNALILSWESHAIYSRFTGNIRKVGLQLYILSHAHDLNMDVFSPDKGIPEKADNINDSDTDEENLDTDEENSETEELPTYRKKHMAQCFIKVTKLCSRNYEPIPKKIRKRWRKFKDDGSGYITEESVRENLQDHKIPVNDMEINGWFKQLRDADKLKFNGDSSSTGEISYITFEEWMMEAFKNCLSFGYTLIDAKSATNTLNNIMWAFIVFVVILCWLLLRGIASVKVVITMVSPFLAATFIFGDMLKAMLGGIIFTFVTHPFFVGNRCIIDNTELEVKQTDILQTTFYKIDSKDEVLYPNKVLAEKIIIKLKRDSGGRGLDSRENNYPRFVLGTTAEAISSDDETAEATGVEVDDSRAK